MSGDTLVPIHKNKGDIQNYTRSQYLVDESYNENVGENN